MTRLIKDHSWSKLRCLECTSRTIDIWSQQKKCGSLMFFGTPLLVDCFNHHYTGFLKWAPDLPRTSDFTTVCSAKICFCCVDIPNIPKAMIIDDYWLLYVASYPNIPKACLILQTLFESFSLFFIIQCVDPLLYPRSGNITT